MTDLPTEPCPQCDGRGCRLLPEAGQRLREVRLAYGVSVRKMAAALDVSESTLCDWESGRRLVPMRIPQEWERICAQHGPHHLPPQDRVEAGPEASAQAPTEPLLRQEVDDGPRQETLARSHPRTIPEEPSRGWELMREQQQKR
jgi:transcriptional regulator with XRE-family HTH domain